MGDSLISASTDRYDVLLVVLGVAIFAAAFLPRVLWKRPLSMPLVLFLLGLACFSLPLNLSAPNPMKDGKLAEHLTELVVTVSLMGAGLKIDRPLSWQNWRGTWRLLGITMPLSIALSAWLGWWIVGFAPATALLLGALIAPTDPVLASEIQVGAPSRGSENAETVSEEDPSDQKEDEFRFALTSEAGLNDGLAFPFVNAALAMAVQAGDSGAWLASWFAVDVLYKLGVGVGSGWLLGRLLGRLILMIPAVTPTAKAMVGPGALAATLVIYGATELAGAYGFVAVFVGALAIRSNRREHAYHESLHTFAEMIERLLTAGVLVAFGGAVAGGLLAPLNVTLVLTAVLIVVAVRPLAGIVGLAGYHQAHPGERWAISFFGVRGIGSFFYLAYALNHHSFDKAVVLWALSGLVVVISIIVHGIAAAPVTESLDQGRAPSKCS